MKQSIRNLANRGDIHILRKIWHVTCGLFALSAYYNSGLDLIFWGYAALIISLVAFSIDFARLSNTSINERAMKIFGPFMRKSEFNSFSGFPFYALGIALSILLFKSDIALISIMFLVFADPLASYIGVRFGKTKILPNKSLEGSLAAMFVCFVISVSYLNDFDLSLISLIIYSLLFSLIGMLSEAVSAFNIDDNLTIPVMSGAGITFLNLAISLF